MAAPAANDSNVISMVVEKWHQLQVEQFSAVHRIKDFPLRLRLYIRNQEERCLAIVCDKSKEAALWKCAVTVTSEYAPAKTFSFSSWSEVDPSMYIAVQHFGDGSQIKVEITDMDGTCERIRPPFDPFTCDGVLVIGEPNEDDDENKIQVDKKGLASQSDFFDRLFFGDFKESKLDEIPIRDVEYEEFLNLIKIIFGFDHTLTDDNMMSVYQLSDKFDLKIVEDRVISFMLSSDCTMSIHNKLLFGEKNKHESLKENIIDQYTRAEMTELRQSEHFKEISHETRDALFAHALKL